MPCKAGAHVRRSCQSKGVTVRRETARSCPPFRVSRFVLMSSRDSVGGGPYVIEEAWPLSGADQRPSATPYVAPGVFRTL